MILKAYKIYILDVFGFFVSSQANLLVIRVTSGQLGRFGGNR